MHQERYEEIMDKLVDIEDSIIKEKIKRRKNKRGMRELKKKIYR